MIDMVEFKIHGIDWTLRVAEEDETIEGDGVGLCDYCTYTITVIDGLKKSQLRTVLLHELTHAFRWTYGMVSELELANIPWTEVEEIAANTVEVFAEEILECADEIMKCLTKKEK